jgi:hypothetical protein
MHKVDLSLDLSSPGLSIRNMSVGELLIALSRQLLSTKTILTPGMHSATLGKLWASDGGDRMEITAILSLRIEDRLTPAKQRAVARVFS